MIARSIVENIATALSQNHRVEVIFRGSDCYTDGKLIVLPSLPDKLPGDLVEMIRGFLDHEVAHIIFSDFKVVEKAAKKGIKDKTPLRFALNAVEDIRIEREMAKVYRGCGVNFEKSREFSMEKFKKSVEATKAAGATDSGDPVMRTMLFFIYICQLGWDHPFVTEYADDIMPLLEHLAPEIEATETLTSTKDALALAEKILEKIETFSMPEPEAPEISIPGEKKGPTGGTEKGSDGPYIEGDSKVLVGEYEGRDEYEETKTTASDDSDEKDEADEDSETPGKSKPEPKAEPASETESKPAPKPETDEAEADDDEADGDEADDSDDEKPSDSDLEKEKDEEAEKTAAELEKELEDHLEEKALERLKKKLRESLESDVERELPSIGKSISEAAKLSTGYRPYSTEKDTFIPHPTRDIKHYNEIADTLTGIVSTLRGRLSRILLSQKRSRWEGNKRRGILNPAQLSQVVAQTSKSVYRTLKEGQQMNTAVEILIDLSGSMGSKIQVTKQTAILLAETLTKIGVPFEIIGFSGDHSSHAPSTADRETFARWGTLDLFYFKTFDERYGQEQKQRIAGMQSHRENYDGESVQFAATRLKARPERKKILFVLSDGAPSAHQCQYRALDKHLKQVVQNLEADPSFTLIAFGMLTSAPKHYYRNYMLVNNLATLPETLMATLYKQLT